MREKERKKERDACIIQPVSVYVGADDVDVTK